jgi:branched-chain amino acid transport system ATP-binding protein
MNSHQVGATAASVPLLECAGLTKCFGQFRAVDGCSFRVMPGSITGLVGPNGAGKTTTFNTLAGALLPDAGKIIFDGQDITRMSADQRFHRGLVRTFQIPHEFAHLSVLENLMVVAQDQPGESLWSNWLRRGKVRAFESETRRKAEEVVDFLEIGPIAHEAAGKISGGQKKLLELGRTMMARSRLVLLDEPAAGVNRTLLRKIEEKIAHLNRAWGFTFILIEHDMEMIERLCDPVICMAEGNVLIEGDFATFRADPRVRDAYLGETEGAAI